MCILLSSSMFHSVNLSDVLLICSEHKCILEVSVGVGECIRETGKEILCYLASLIPLFVWLQAFRLSVRGLCSET